MCLQSLSVSGWYTWAACVLRADIFAAALGVSG